MALGFKNYVDSAPKEQYISFQFVDEYIPVVDGVITYDEFVERYGASQNIHTSNFYYTEVNFTFPIDTIKDTQPIYRIPDSMEIFNARLLLEMDDNLLDEDQLDLKEVTKTWYSALEKLGYGR
ncbi:hypothetical protein phiOC_p406 [Ochrobactrum phage vB_OspM_OC]|nr:hypothetical protein phiOC_p406 [Ochrobactrum phage vB_OspM_OC]